MHLQEWEILIGVGTAALLAAGPWMLMVHSRLAVLSSQVTRLEKKVDRLVDCDEEGLPQRVRHEAAFEELSRRVQSHEVQLAALAHRLQEAV